MDIAIELIVFLAMGFVLITWFVWDFVTTKFNIRRYKPENDRGRKAEEQRIADRATESTRIADELSRERNVEQRGVLQTTSSESIGGNKTSPRSINPFTRFRR